MKEEAFRDSASKRVASGYPDSPTPTKKKSAGGQGSGGGGSASLSFKRTSMASLGLAKADLSTQFDEEEDGLDDDEAPGAFKRPSSAYKLAK